MLPTQRHVMQPDYRLLRNSITRAADFHGDRDLPAIPGEQAGQRLGIKIGPPRTRSWW